MFAVVESAQVTITHDNFRVIRAAIGFTERCYCAAKHHAGECYFFRREVEEGLAGRNIMYVEHKQASVNNLCGEVVAASSYSGSGFQ